MVRESSGTPVHSQPRQEPRRLPYLLNLQTQLESWRRQRARIEPEPRPGSAAVPPPESWALLSGCRCRGRAASGAALDHLSLPRLVDRSPPGRDAVDRRRPAGCSAGLEHRPSCRRAAVRPDGWRSGGSDLDHAAAPPSPRVNSATAG